LPVPKDKQPATLKLRDTLFISKNKTVQELSEKFSRVYSNIFPKYDFSKAEKRVWKIDPRFDLVTAWDKWTEKNFNVQGAILKEDNSIEVFKLSF